MHTQLQTVPEGVGAFCTERTFGPFFFYCFQVAVGVCPRGPLGRSRGFGLCAQPRPPRRLAWALRPSLQCSREDNVQQETDEVSLSSARANPRSVPRVGWEGARRKPGIQPPARESCAFVESGQDRPTQRAEESSFRDQHLEC